MGGQPSSKLSITVFSAEMMISKEWRSKSFSLVDSSRGSSSISEIFRPVPKEVIVSQNFLLRIISVLISVLGPSKYSKKLRILCPMS